MEMQAITTEGAKKQRDVEPMLDEQPAVLKDADPFPYSKLQRPSEDIYTQPSLCDVTKSGIQCATVGTFRMYRIACLVLSIICLLLLMVIIILGVKFQHGSTECSVNEKFVSDKQALSTCSYSQCQDYVSKSVPPLTMICNSIFVFQLVLCVPGLSDPEGENEVLDRTEGRQTTHGPGSTTPRCKPAIGLKIPLQGDCAVINSDSALQKNWVRASCNSYTYFICQLQM
ncbi:hypothetical protein E3U43_019446 [Larimichthys crocea]|uniref:Uncharacterized protein n=1 Tax=Larimichthys crocea TaxID=215358 RepID=A0ACD3QTK5_LARCR|nr:hypothetical protein E3U43_019446 [Larimichthys crocea]